MATDAHGKGGAMRNKAGEQHDGVEHRPVRRGDGGDERERESADARVP